MKAVLNLTIKRKWFYMIASGKKKEEYRDCENRQVQRFFLWATNDNWGYDHYWGKCHPVVIFRNGYRMDSIAIAVEIIGCELRGRDGVRHPEWGEPRCRRLHFAVKLGEIVARGTYAEIRGKLEKATGKMR